MTNSPVRTETQSNNFGVVYTLGQEFSLHKKFGKNDGEKTFITEILPSGLFFKVDKCDIAFSIKTLHSKGSTISSGYYLYKI